MKKKGLALVLAAVLLAMFVAACGGDGGGSSVTGSGSSGSQASGSTGGGAGAGEEYTFSMFAVITDDVELPDNKAFQLLEEMTGIHWEVQSSFISDLVEKRNLLLASNQYPDVFFKASLDNTTLNQYGSQGIFIPLNDLIDEYMPNLKKLMEENPNILKALANEDGIIYSLPEITYSIPAINLPFINMAWLDNLGLDEPTNPDQLYDVLKAFKEQDANGNGDPDDEYAWVPTDLTPPQLMLHYFGLNTDFATYTYRIDAETLGYIPQADEFKEFLAWARRCYEDGLMDKDAFVRPHDQLAAIGKSGDVLGMFIEAGSFLAVGRSDEGGYSDQYQMLTPFYEGVVPVSTGVASGTMAITDNCANPEVVAQWADYFYGEEGGRLTWMGIVDKSYEFNDDGSWNWIASDDGNQYNMQGTCNHPSLIPELAFSDPNISERELTADRLRVAEMGSDPFPSIGLNEAANKTVASVKADTAPYVDQYIAQVITGEVDLESSWDNFQQTLKQMGCDEMLQLYQDAYSKTL